MLQLELNTLKELEFSKQAIFAYLTCNRLYPNYDYFSNNFHFGDPDVLRQSLNYLYDAVFEVNPDIKKINSLIKKIESVTPDTEDFATIFVSSALDACTAIMDSLGFLIDKDFSRIKNISSYATDTVDMYIQEIEKLDFNKDKDFQKKIDNHPLMKKEVNVQSGIIKFLAKREDIDVQDIQTLINLQENNQSNLLL